MRKKIPNGWNSSELGEILVGILDFRGKTPKKIGMKWGNGEIPALSANNVEMGGINFEKETYYGSEALHQKWMNKGNCELNDVIMTMEAPLGNIAQIPDDNKYILSQRVILLKEIKEIIDKNYLAYFLMSEYFQSQLIKYSSGTTAKGIQQSKLIELNVLFPKSKEEQKKIASILRIIDRTIEKSEKIIEKYEMLKQGLMHDLFIKGLNKDGTPIEGWDLKKLIDLSQFIKDGTHGSFQDHENGIPMLSAKDIKFGKILLDNNPRTISISDYESIHKNYHIQKEDILLTIVGTIGRTAIVNTDELFTLQRSVSIIRPLEDVDTLYMCYYMNSSNFQKALDIAVNASAQGGVYLGELNKMDVLIPSDPKEQACIADKLLSIDNVLTLERKYLSKLQKIKQGLMQDLLTGKVSVET